VEIKLLLLNMILLNENAVIEYFLDAS